MFEIFLLLGGTLMAFLVYRAWNSDVDDDDLILWWWLFYMNDDNDHNNYDE